MASSALRDSLAASKSGGGDAPEPDAAKKGKEAKDGKKGKRTKKVKDPNKKSLLKNKKFIMVVVALLGVGYGVYSFLAPAAPVPPPAAGVQVPLDPTTINLASGHYLKVVVSVVLVAGKATLASFEPAHAQQLVISEFSNRTVAELSSNSARAAHQKHLVATMQAAYPDTACTATQLKSTAPAVVKICTLVFNAFTTQFVTQ